MALYSVNSTSSYMQAMKSMIEALSSVPIQENKEPKVDTERVKEIPLDLILLPFKDLNIQDREFLEAGSDSALAEQKIHSIRRECESLSQEQFEGSEGIFSSIVNMVKSASGDEELQSGLFDILGFEKFDLISNIIRHKEALQQVLENEARGQFLSALERNQQVIENRRKAKKQELGPKIQNRRYPHVYKNFEADDALLITGKKFSLPAGTTRDSYPTHEEVIIPYPEHSVNKWIADDALVRVGELDFLCQGTFRNYKTLNRMQSLVYPVAYDTNENMLICAPTGAGKTDVALLTILHTINQFMTESISSSGEHTVDIDYDEFKIVYVAPLKALAAEIVDKFSSKLKWLGINVRELTGDIQLSKKEIMTTQVIVTTPEKWDVVTRKLNGDNELVSKVKLLIIDEVHLLHEDRGSVLETLVARTLRQVESSQMMIRIVGLSATLPNYMDVADFLGVNRSVGMFYFDQSFRPCPLKQDLIGVRGKSGSKTARENIDRVSYEKLANFINEGLQVMVFVHSRKDTVNTARTYIGQAQSNHEIDMFDTSNSCDLYDKYKREVSNKNRNKDIRELFQFGFGIHHAGLLRSDRNLVEKMFTDGAIKVLCCTATLAWGVNLPAAVVIVKGTQVYDSKQGGFADLGISDVIQIFGRAGRPQFEKFGTGILCTTSDKLDHYISLLTQQHPIESKLFDRLVDNLNAEISLGSVTNIEEGIQWLGYTYMFVRMRKNPISYGMDWTDVKEDPLLRNKRHDLVVSAAQKLHSLQMVVFDETTGTLTPKDLGRIASEFYLLNHTIEIFNTMLDPRAGEADILSLISMSGEFDSIKFREEEKTEVKKLLENEAPCQISGEVESPQGKVNVLLQSYISQAPIKDSALVSDCNYVAQNSARICRALFLVGINRKWGAFLNIILSLCKAIDKRLWPFDHPLAQFDLPENVLKNLRAKNLPMEHLKDLSAGELGDLVHNNKMGKTLYKIIDRFPSLDIESEIFPITSNIMRIKITIEPNFTWDERYHGHAQFFWITVEESDKSSILHIEKFILNERLFRNPHELDFMIPLSDPLPPQIVVKAVSDSWIGSETVHPISFQHLICPSNETIRTNLLRLQPLPITALHDTEIEAIYSSKFRYFNPMQTMVFHSLYNSSSNAFVGSPTGSGKTIVAELAIWHAFKQYPKSKVVYIAPMKALVRERVDDWKKRLCSTTSHLLVELTGDSLPDARDVKKADIIITTPEKFDGISRNWQTRSFVQEISLVIMDEIHLLASDRGPILEMIVSRMNYISDHTRRPIRLLGMSTAVSNAVDMAGWLGVKEGLFNFPQSVRPVPLNMYIDGFPDNLAFCPLMKAMNKPAFMAIKQHSPSKPALIFVPSRRQTRLTALDLIHMCGMESDPRRFLRMSESELEGVLDKVQDDTLRLSLQFGIGVHHAGLVESDRQFSHKLFEKGKIQVLVATSTLAWGVNLPAHLVIIKGTQFFDPKIEAYRDMDLTDILQMMGRAGRPSFDDSGTALIFTKQAKKTFYKHFLNLGFPVESSLHKVLDDHIGAEISAGTIDSKQKAMEFLTWTFLYRRVHKNPTYYGIKSLEQEEISKYLTDMIDKSISNLVESRCLIEGNKDELIPTPFLHISSYYYLSHMTIRNFLSKVKPDSSFRDCLKLLSDATEYNELATRHGEELINMELSQNVRYPAEDMEKEFIWDPHVKVYLLLQAYMSRIELPIADYAQDTVSVLDQALRILQAYIDAAAELGFLETVKSFIQLMICIKQRYWFDEDPVEALLGFSLQKEGHEKRREDIVTLKKLGGLRKNEIVSLVDEMRYFRDRRKADDEDDLSYEKLNHVIGTLPTSDMKLSQENPEQIVIELLHRNYPYSKNFNMYCPHFPKAQRESWFVIICDEASKELLLLKRAAPIPFNNKGKVSCKLNIPDYLRGLEVTVWCFNDAIDIAYKERTTLK